MPEPPDLRYRHALAASAEIVRTLGVAGPEALAHAAYLILAAMYAAEAELKDLKET